MREIIIKGGKGLKDLDRRLRYESEAYDRLRAPSPRFFKVLARWCGLGLILVSGGLAVASGFGAPAGVLVVLGALDAMMGTALTVGKFAVDGGYDRESRKAMMKTDRNLAMQGAKTTVPYQPVSTSLRVYVNCPTGCTCGNCEQIASQIAQRGYYEKRF